jgi:excisionase family DNA binding protein
MNQITSANPEPYVDVQTVAEFLGVPKSWIYEQARRYGMPHRFAGRYLRFRLSEVEAWLDEQRMWEGRS